VAGVLAGSQAHGNCSAGLSNHFDHAAQGGTSRLAGNRGKSRRSSILWSRSRTGFWNRRCTPNRGWNFFASRRTTTREYSNTTDFVIKYENFPPRGLSAEYYQNISIWFCSLRGGNMARVVWVVFLVFVAALFGGACSETPHRHGVPDGGDTDTDADTDTDTDTDADGGTEWCPELPTSCPAPTALESCGDNTLGAPRLIAPLSGKYVRDRRPEIIWDGAASGVSQYRVEIARDRAFTEIVYRSTTYEAYPGIDNRFQHIVTCDLDCGVHFFRVLSVTSPECEVGTPTYFWEIFVGMTPNDIDHDGVPDILCWHVEPPTEFEDSHIQGYAITHLDDKAGQTIGMSDLTLVADVSTPNSVFHTYAIECGDLNGDSNVEFGLIASHELPGPVYTTEFYAFSLLSSIDVQTKEDAFFFISSIEGNSFTPTIFDYAGSRDVNGDGFEDIYLVSPSGDHFLYLGNSDGFQGSLASADVHFSFPENVSFVPHFLLDLNGDGFSDIGGTTQDNDSFAILGFSALFGAEGISGDNYFTDISGSITVASSDFITSDWNLGTSFSVSSIAGDADFDGYPELSVIFPEAIGPSSTGASGILGVFSQGAPVPFSEILDVLLYGFFPWPEDISEEYPRSNLSIPTGDVNDDGLPDLLFYEDNIDHAFSRFFLFNGRENWNGSYSAASADVVLDWEPGDFTFSARYLSDIDGDSLPEKAVTTESCSGISILLSSSADSICLPDSILNGYCGYPGSILLPDLLQY
jgi:hypothetical protein